jgi:hypothetical protein
MENETVLFSVQKGFWNAYCGWVSHLCQADKTSVKAMIQINFKNTRDVFRIPLSAIQQVDDQSLQEKLGISINVNQSDTLLLPGELIEILQKTNPSLGVALWYAKGDGYYIIKLDYVIPITLGIP